MTTTIRLMAAVAVIFSFVPLSLAAKAVKIKTRNIDQIVEEIQTTYQNMEDLSADFTQSTKVILTGKSVSGNGKIYLKKPGMLRIEYTSPEPKYYISDGKKLWIVNLNENQAEEYALTSKAMSQEALQFLKGLGRLDREFRITELKNNDSLTMIPRSENAPYSKLECTFGADNILKQVTIHNKSGNISTYNFSAIATNQGTDNALFSLDKKAKYKMVKGN